MIKEIIKCLILEPSHLGKRFWYRLLIAKEDYQMKINQVWPVLINVNPIWRPIHAKVYDLPACTHREAGIGQDWVIMKEICCMGTVPSC